MYSMFEINMFWDFLVLPGFLQGVRGRREHKAIKLSPKPLKQWAPWKARNLFSLKGNKVTLDPIRFLTNLNSWVHCIRYSGHQSLHLNSKFNRHKAHNHFRKGCLKTHCLFISLLYKNYGNFLIKLWKQATLLIVLRISYLIKDTLCW